jgi:hypothetical protein
VIDTEHDGRRTISGWASRKASCTRPTRIAYVIANGSAGRVDFVDGTSLRTVAQVTGLDDADNVRWLPASLTVIVGYGKGALRMLDVTGRSRGDIPLPGHPESFQVDPDNRRIYVNVPYRSRGPRRRSRSAPRSSTLANAPGFGQLSDGAGLAGTQAVRGCAVRPPSCWSTTSRAETSSHGFRLVAITDDVYFDVQRKRVYVICGAGRWT